MEIMILGNMKIFTLKKRALDSLERNGWEKG
jgi:hypothetical protein